MAHLVVAGSDTGVSAGLRAREVAPSVEVTLVVADTYPNVSICGLSFYLSDEQPDSRQLARLTEQKLEGAIDQAEHAATVLCNAQVKRHA